MCRNHEVVSFTWDHRYNEVTGALLRHETAYSPLGTRRTDGLLDRQHLRSWLIGRSIPLMRPDVRRKLKQLGFDQPVDLLLSTYAVSLSDQFWLRPQGEQVEWSTISPFVNDLPLELGDYLTVTEKGKAQLLSRDILTNLTILNCSPDSTLGGTLIKRWEVRNGVRILVKGGRSTMRLQEPFNESIASQFGAKLFQADEYVSYVLMTRGFAQYESACPCMCDDSTALVPALQIFQSNRRPNDLSYHEHYVQACARHGLDVRQQVEKMLVLDHLVCNFDRHWNNFGVLVDSESAQWLRPAPIFDTGESLWCDREMAQGFGGYRMYMPGQYRPFRMRIDTQLQTFCKDLSWYDPSMLDGFEQAISTTLSGNPFVSSESGRVDAIVQAVADRIQQVTRQAERNKILIAAHHHPTAHTVTSL